MASAALVSAAQAMEPFLLGVQNHSTPLQKQILKSLNDDIISLQVFLHDVPKQTQIPEAQIMDAAYEVEDVLEEFLSKHVKSDDEIKPIPYPITYQLSGPDQLKHLHPHLTELFQKLQTVRKKIKFVVKEAAKIKKNHKISEIQLMLKSIAVKALTIFKPERETLIKYKLSDAFWSGRPRSRLISIGESDTMVGFDEDLETIMKQLASIDKSQLFIPIVGMGGIGKTTLARNAYNNQVSVEIFHLRAWVTVSQDYIAVDVYRNLLVSLGAFNSEMEEGNYAEYVHKYLKGRKYLVVLDDVWSIVVLDDVMRFLPDDGNGSRIMLTTRLSDVASYPIRSSTRLHQMHFLNAEQSWDLLRQRVPQPQPDINIMNRPFSLGAYLIQIRGIAKEIAGSCGGLPLGIVVVAGILSTVDPTPSSWQNIRDMIRKGFAARDEKFENIFSLSYSYLPRHLRSCFLYFGAFPEDYEIPASRLIKLWVAEGFLETKGGSISKSLEERGEGYLEDLVRLNLVLVRKRSLSGKIKTCGIHDLLRDMCIRKAHEEKFLLSVTTNYSSRIPLVTMMIQRRIALSSGFCGMEEIANSTLSLRTLLYFPRFDLQLESFDLLQFQLLRVFDALQISFLNFPNEVFELFLLRYLALKFHSLGDGVSDGILKLQKLQTLILHPSWISSDMIQLPIVIWKMPQLRHIICPLGISLPSLIESCALENLQTISMVEGFQWSERACKMFPNLKKLVISLSPVRGDEESVSEVDSLMHLPKVENLKIRSKIRFPIKQKIVFPETLKKLTLQNMSILPCLWIDGSFPSLEVLKLNKCYVAEHSESKKWETEEGQFPLLECLLIDETDIELWITESSHFPKLMHLRIYHCRQLKEIPLVIGDIDTLELIEVDDSNTSLVDSAKMIQEQIQDYGNQIEVTISRAPYGSGDETKLRDESED